MAESVQALFTRHVSARAHKDGTPMPFPFICLGLVGESAEAMDEARKYDFVREDLIDEVGDTLWYLEAICALKYNTGLLLALTRVDDGGSFMSHLGSVAELAKKEAWHGKSADLTKLAYHLGAVLLHLESTAVAFGFTLEDAMRANIVKLERRYPVGFVEGGGIRD